MSVTATVSTMSTTYSVYSGEGVSHYPTPFCLIQDYSRYFFFTVPYTDPHGYPGVTRKDSSAVNSTLGVQLTVFPCFDFPSERFDSWSFTFQGSHPCSNRTTSFLFYLPLSRESTLISPSVPGVVNPGTSSVIRRT